MKSKQKTIREYCLENGILGEIMLRLATPERLDKKVYSFSEAIERFIGDWDELYGGSEFWAVLYNLTEQQEEINNKPTYIEKGSIVTIDGKDYLLEGNATLVKKEELTLEVGKTYLVKWTEQFTHVKNGYSFLVDDKPRELIFVGKILLSVAYTGYHNIFFDEYQNSYYMFDNDDLSYVVKKLN